MPLQHADTIKQAKTVFQDDKAAERYANAENATRHFCKVIVEKSGLAKVDHDIQVLDLATGTGAAIQELYDAVPKERWEHLKVLGGDTSPVMLEYLKARGEQAGWTGLETKVVDGNKIDLPEASYTHIFVGFGIFVMPDALPKLFRLLKPGGYLGISTWSRLMWVPVIQSSVSKMKSQPYCPTESEMENKLFAGRPWGKAEYVAEQLRQAGFDNVDTADDKHTAKVGTPSSYMETMQFPIKMVMGYFWIESGREEQLQELNEIMYKDVVQMMFRSCQSPPFPLRPPD